MNHKSFDPEKAVEAIVYVTCKLPEATLHRISKVLYFADLWHLERYGRLVLGDSYVAMKHGPVPSGVYDLLKYVRGDGHFIICEVPHIKEAFKVSGCHVKSLREPDVDALSQSDVAALDAGIQACEKLDFSQPSANSHGLAWEHAGLNDLIDVEDMINYEIAPECRDAVLNYWWGRETA